MLDLSRTAADAGGVVGKVHRRLVIAISNIQGGAPMSLNLDQYFSVNDRPKVRGWPGKRTTTLALLATEFQ